MNYLKDFKNFIQPIAYTQKKEYQKINGKKVETIVDIPVYNNDIEDYFQYIKFTNYKHKANTLNLYLSYVDKLTRDWSTISSFISTNIEQHKFNKLVMENSLYIKMNQDASAEFKNVHITLFYVLMKYYNLLVPRVASGQFKVIFEIDHVSRTFLINNNFDLRMLLCKLFFNVLTTINQMGDDAIEYVINSGGEDGMYDPGLYDDDYEVDENGEFVSKPYAEDYTFKVQQFDLNLYAINQPMKSNQIIRGGKSHSQLCLKKEHTNSVINPNNKDKYCILYCAVICKYLYYTDRKEIANEYNKTENFPEIQQKVDFYIPLTDHLFGKDHFICTEKNIEALERIMSINLNIYVFSDDKNKVGFDLYYRSTFKNGINDDVIRVIFYPFNEMTIKSKTNKKDTLEINNNFFSEFKNLSVNIDRESYFERNQGHYVAITKTLSALDRGISKTNDTKICPFCDIAFTTESMLIKHKNECKNSLASNNEDRIITYVNNKEGATRSFKKHCYLSKANFVIYADTETQVNHFENNEIVAPSPHRLISYKLFLQCEYDDKYSFSITRTANNDSEVGDFLLKQFMHDITNLRAYISNINNQYPKLNNDEAKEFKLKFPKSNAKCLFCDSKDKLVVHHDHNKEKNHIIGYLCNSCNISEAKVHGSVSIVFHNLNYDLLVLIRSIVHKQNIKLVSPNQSVFNYNKDITVNVTNNVEIIAKTSCKYATMNITGEYVESIEDNEKIFLIAVKFIDSYAFVNSSLGNIVQQMKTDGNKTLTENLDKIYPITYKLIQNKYHGNEELFNLSNEKGLIAYSHINCENLKSKNNLSIDCYKNDLYMDYSDEYISLQPEEKQIKLNEIKISQYEELVKDYNRTNIVYDILTTIVGKENMNYKVYFEYYLDLDIALLADFFNNLRTKLISTHKLDPCYYIGLPSYSMASCFYLTKKSFSLIEDVNISKMISNNCRGGFSAIFNKSFESEGKKKFVYGVDVNNLYGYVMKLLLPNEFLGMIDDNDVIMSEIENYFKYKNEFFTNKTEINEYSPYTYFLMTDFVIPDKIHDKLMKFPPLVTKRTVTYEDLSTSQINEKKKSIKTRIESYKSEKLCATLESGNDYLMGIDNYKFYKDLGYEISVKKIYKFKQERLLEEYIDLNSGLRQKCVNELEKNLYKLLNNAVYGKQLQNPCNYSEFEMMSDEKLIQKRLNSPFFKAAKVIVDDELILMDKYKNELKFDTAIQIGFMILEKSKLHMYGSLYNSFIPFFEKENIDWKILFHDTDSFYFGVDLNNSRFNTKNEMVASLHKENPKLLDLHKYEDVSVRDTSNKKVVGLFLDEESDVDTINGFVGLCSKSYALLKTIRSNKKDDKGNYEYKIKLEMKGKGVSNKYLSNLYSYEDYKKVLNGELLNDTVKFNNIVKKGFNNVVQSVEKVTLTRFDDKFYYYIENGITKSVPYGYYGIKNIVEE